MRIFWSGLCLALALLLESPLAAWADFTVCSSGCDVSSIIDSNRTWREGTYRVQEHIQVRPGVTLTLEPGVMLKFSTGVSLLVQGTLIARGTEEKRITFTSGQASPAPGNWGSILFTEAAVGASFDAEGNYVSGSLFEHCVVEYAVTAIRARSPRAPYVYHSTIRSNGGWGIWFGGPPKPGGSRDQEEFSNLGVQEGRVRESILENNVYGIFVSSSSTGLVTISGNTISENRGSGIFVTADSNSSRKGLVTISGNTISKNYGGGPHQELWWWDLTLARGGCDHLE